MSRRIIGVVLGLGLVLGLVAGPAMAPGGEPEPAAAADLSQFQAGRIITDELFFDGGAMTAPQVQAFLEQEVPRCDPGALCLRDYGIVTPSKPADAACRGYSGGRVESGAQIIANVGASCGISPRVILVMLEKEQTLVSRKNLSWDAWAWKASMGYACPDSGPGGSAQCDAEYYGFFNQVYNGVRQLKRYGISSTFNWFPVGKTSNIQYHPNTSCGTKPVYIENKATAALYYYTPYTPNAASLAAGYGVGDRCSSYGNRNFFSFYSDWFGSPIGYPVRGGIGTKYWALGGPAGHLGSATGPEVCGIKDNGCYQEFQRGAITWTPKLGGFATWGGIRERWRATDFERGPLGYPIGDEVCGLVQSGCYQTFEGGAILWSPSSGAWESSGATRERWASTGYERGPLGYPTSGVVCTLPDGGCYQGYQRGAITTHPTAGTWGTWGGIRTRWGAIGFEGGVLGYPVGPEVCGGLSGGCYQNFQNGAISWVPSLGGWETYGEIRNAWAASRYEFGMLSYPKGAPSCSGGICQQQFVRGTIVQPVAGGPAYPVWGGIVSAWNANGGLGGKLGAPISREQTDGTTTWQEFQKGKIVWDIASSSASVVLN